MRMVVGVVVLNSEYANDRWCCCTKFWICEQAVLNLHFTWT